MCSFLQALCPLRLCKGNRAWAPRHSTQCAMHLATIAARFAECGELRCGLHFNGGRKERRGASLLLAFRRYIDSAGRGVEGGGRDGRGPL